MKACGKEENGYMGFLREKCSDLISELALYREYKESLGITMVQIGPKQYPAHHWAILKYEDEIAYRCGFNDYIGNLYEITVGPKLYYTSKYTEQELLDMYEEERNEI